MISKACPHQRLSGRVLRLSSVPFLHRLDCLPEYRTVFRSIGLSSGVSDCLPEYRTVFRSIGLSSGVSDCLPSLIPSALPGIRPRPQHVRAGACLSILKRAVHFHIQQSIHPPGLSPFSSFAFLRSAVHAPSPKSDVNCSEFLPLGLDLSPGCFDALVHLITPCLQVLGKIRKWWSLLQSSDVWNTIYISNLQLRWEGCTTTLALPYPQEPNRLGATTPEIPTCGGSEGRPCGALPSPAGRRRCRLYPTKTSSCVPSTQFRPTGSLEAHKLQCHLKSLVRSKADC